MGAGLPGTGPLGWEPDVGFGLSAPRRAPLWLWYSSHLWTSVEGMKLARLQLPSPLFQCGLSFSLLDVKIFSSSLWVILRDGCSMCGSSGVSMRIEKPRSFCSGLLSSSLIYWAMFILSISYSMSIFFFLFEYPERVFKLGFFACETSRGLI